MVDEPFTPHIGRSAPGRPADQRFLGKILAAAGPLRGSRSKRGPRFDGSRIGRGASIGRVLARREAAAQQGRRVVIKCHLVRVGGRGPYVVRAHLSYLQRDGVARDRTTAALYGQERDIVDSASFLDQSREDRHQFRIIVSAEDGAEYGDLKPFIRRLMMQVEQDLGTKLNWIAADHYRTGQAHTHIMVRGVDDEGANLIIAREYTAHGLRARAIELITLDLGPVASFDISRNLEQDIGAMRVLPIDRDLIVRSDENLVLRDIEPEGPEQRLSRMRLARLQELELAQDLGDGRWQLAQNFEDKLQRLHERTVRVERLQATLRACKLDRPGVDLHVVDVVDASRLPITGKLVMHGIDQSNFVDGQIIDGIDGRVHLIASASSEMYSTLQEGAIVRISNARDQHSESRGPSGVHVEILSAVPLEQLPQLEAATWLDRTLIETNQEPVRNLGFGAQVRTALMARQKWLLDAGLAEELDGQIRYRDQLIAILQRRELLDVASGLSQELGLPFSEPDPHGDIDGTVRRHIDLHGRRFALVERSHEFTLVPWREEFRRGIGPVADGVPGGDGSQYRHNRGPEIS